MRKLSTNPRAVRSRKWWRKNRERMKAYSRKWYAANREKIRAQQQVRYLANREKYLARSRRTYAKNAKLGKRYRTGLPIPTRNPPRGCELCSRVQRRNLSLDHCHETNVFRGWLCTQCNIGLGMFRSDRTLLRKASAYLRRAERA